ncbi:MAG TPA: CcmD family protein [Sporolactobacillaceae bacterium]|nr:CcmD family protein [Sporolactobacillaceae bacterium]
MEHLGYLFAAYTIVFAVIFLYVLFIWRRQAALEAELRSLEARLRAGSENSEDANSMTATESPRQL